MKNTIKYFFRLFNLELIKTSNYSDIIYRLNQFANNENKLTIENDTYKEVFIFLNGLLEGPIDKIMQLWSQSKAQLKQDIFVLIHLNFKKEGFFVEFGATNGIDLSNTYLLESKFNWNGILAEPSKGWHKNLMENRSCYICTDCVWSKSNELIDFNQVENQELSTISLYNNSDSHKETRTVGTNYKVKTISLNELLKRYHAPKVIDYLSIDTEGSEFDILKELDFEQFSFRVITVEHNYTSKREKIYNLLTEKGYLRKFTLFSKWDDWYFLE